MAAKPGKSTDILDAVALIVVDMQRSILEVVEGAPAVVERCGFAIEAARTLGLRILFTEQVPAKLGGTDPRLLALVPGARVFPKNTFSALQAEGLLDYLRRHGVYHLLLVGIEIPVCIYQTALHAVDSDLDVTVLSDAVAGRRMDDSLVTLEALTRAHCHLLPAETVYYSMLGNSGHPLFSAFNALVKRYAQPGGLDAAPPPPAPREPHHPRRPALAAPEDLSDASPVDDVPSENADTSIDSEPYIGRGADGNAASESRASSEHAAGGDDDSFDDDERDEAQSTDDDSPGDELAASPDGSGGSSDESRSPADQAEPTRRRRGRRRGGARRRRSRERREAPAAAGSSSQPGTAGGATGGDSAAPPDRSAESDASGNERASE